MDEEYGCEYDEGSDIDNWEAEQVFQDREHEAHAEAGDWEVADAEADFRDAYEAALGVRPVFSVEYLSASELRDRAGSIRQAHAAGRFA